MFGPQIYLILALLAAVPSTYGVMKMKQMRVEVAAFEAGKKVGAETVAATVSKQANDIIAAVSDGEATAPVVSAEKEAIAALCQKSASCRERKRP